MMSQDLFQELPEHLRSFAISAERVGSRETCSPPPTDTDFDILYLLSADAADLIHDAMAASGANLDGSRIENSVNYLSDEARFTSFRNGDVNLILTCSDAFYRRFLAASSIAKHLNLLRKGDRIALFQAVLYGNRYCPEPEFAEAFA